MKAITQTYAANHQKHDPQITKQVCKSVSKNASVEHHTTSTVGGLKKKKSLRNLGKMNPFLTSIFFSNGLKPPTRRPGRRFIATTAFLSLDAIHGTSTGRTAGFWSEKRRRLNRVIQQERKYDAYMYFMSIFLRRYQFVLVGSCKFT